MEKNGREAGSIIFSHNQHKVSSIYHITLLTLKTTRVIIEPY